MMMLQLREAQFVSNQTRLYLRNDLHSCVCKREHTEAQLSLNCSTFVNVKLLIIFNYSNDFKSCIRCD